MARKPRVHFPGALYHVISRGNRRQQIFRTDADRQRYLALLNHYRLRYKFQLRAYTLMSNHIHLLMEVVKTPSSRLNEVAARYGRDQVSLSLGVKRLRERMGRDAEPHDHVSSLLRQLQDPKVNN